MAGARLTKKNDEYLQTGASYEIYSDFNSMFLPHPNTGQVTRKTNIESIKQAVRNLVLTDKYERVRNFDFGTDIKRYLFENFDKITQIELKQKIEAAIKRFEPRVNVEEVIVDPSEDTNTLFVTIRFHVVMIPDVQQVNLTFYRVR